jgi:hypothetical protein
LKIEVFNGGYCYGKAPAGMFFDWEGVSILRAAVPVDLSQLLHTSFSKTFLLRIWLIFFIRVGRFQNPAVWDYMVPGAIISEPALVLSVRANFDDHTYGGKHGTYYFSFRVFEKTGIFSFDGSPL